MRRNKKEQIISKIYEKIMEKGTHTTRANEMYSSTDERLENKIHVLKLPVEIEDVCGSTVKMLSVAAETEDFSKTRISDVRIGFEEPRQKIWSNIYATEATDEMLDIIAVNLKISV